MGRVERMKRAAYAALSQDPTSLTRTASKYEIRTLRASFEQLFAAHDAHLLALRADVQAIARRLDEMFTEVEAKSPESGS